MSQKNKKIQFLFLFIIIIVVAYLYGRYINTEGLKVIETPVYISNLPASYNGLKIAQFSDLLYSSTIDKDDLQLIKEEINKLNADIIIFTGDLSFKNQLNEEDKLELTTFLKDLNSKINKLAIIGDHDLNYLEDYKTILEESDFTLLDDSSQKVYYKDDIPINFIGLTNPENYSQIYEENQYTITLTHKPDNIKYISNSNVVFAGHSLGGQIKLPFIGGIIKTEGANTYIDNHSQLNNQDLYISNGLGTPSFKFRFLNKPSINLYRIYSSN